MIVKLLTEHHFEFLSLKGGCRGSSESTHTKMPHCWKYQALAHIILLTQVQYRTNYVPLADILFFVFGMDQHQRSFLFALKLWTVGQILSKLAQILHWGQCRKPKWIYKIFITLIYISRLPGSYKSMKKDLSALYLLNQSPEFDQTGTDISLEHLKKGLNFGDLDLIFKVTRLI